MTNYLSFDLLIDRIDPTDNKFRVRLLFSPVGQATHFFVLSSVEPYFDPKTGRRTSKSLLKFGAQLFNALFGGEVLTAFRRSLDEAERQGAGLRIWLRLAEVPELARLPWEYLYDESRGRFVALSKRTVLARYLALPEQNKPLLIESPLRILVVLSSPLDQPRLNVEQEWKNLQQALGKLVKEGKVEVQRLKRATLPALQRQLRQQTYHILHFIGHGGFNEYHQTGFLCFETNKRLSHAVSANDLAHLLHDHDSLRLALLNACKGSQSADHHSFTSVASALMQQAIPAVIAMQFDMTDRAAIIFAHEFYQAIADHLPLDAAITEGRRAIYNQVNQIEWGTPVLHMRAPDGHIFKPKPTTTQTPGSINKKMHLKK